MADDDWPEADGECRPRLAYEIPQMGAVPAPNPGWREEARAFFAEGMALFGKPASQ